MTTIVRGGEVLEVGHDHGEPPDVEQVVQVIVNDLADAIETLPEDVKVKWRAYAARALCLDCGPVYARVILLLDEWQRVENDAWRGETCPDCGRIKAVGADHICERNARQSYGELP